MAGPWQHSEDCAAPPAAVWAVWADVEGWPAWDPALRSATLSGGLRPGARGRLRSVRGPVSSFRVGAVEEGVRFEEVSRLPLARVVVEHEVAPRRGGGGGSTVTHRIRLRGPLGGPWSRLVGRRLAESLPGAVRGVVRAAEARAAG